MGPLILLAAIVVAAVALYRLGSRTSGASPNSEQSRSFWWRMSVVQRRAAVGAVLCCVALGWVVLSRRGSGAAGGFEWASTSMATAMEVGRDGAVTFTWRLSGFEAYRCEGHTDLAQAVPTVVWQRGYMCQNFTLEWADGRWWMAYISSTGSAMNRRP